MSEGVVSLQTTRDTGYQSYIMVQNELTRAFNEVRDEVAQRKFGAKFADLPEELRNVSHGSNEKEGQQRSAPYLDRFAS